MAELPEFLTDQTEEAIRQRILDRLPSDFDKSEGSFFWNIAAAVAIELVLGADWAKQVLERGFAQTAFGEYLTLRAEEHGVIRKAAIKATGIATFSGIAGTLIPAGTRISTASTEEKPAIVFTTNVDAIISGSGTVDVSITAEEAGVSGNVAAGSITFLVDQIAGVSSVTNLAATSGGMDEESDESLLERYFARVRNPSASGNKADYINWALEVPGVGGVAVVPQRDGPGTVSIAIIDANKEPANQSLVDAVQDYIAPPWRNLFENMSAMVFSGFGVSIDETQPDASINCVKMIYDPGGNGVFTHQDIDLITQQAGIWQARIRVKVDNAGGSADLLQIGVYNLTTSSWAKTSMNGTTDAVITLKASNLGASFQEKTFDFAWNGTDRLELRVTRLQTDTTTTVWIDSVEYRSAFSKDTAEGKAPIGARVTVEPAASVPIHVSATLVISPEYNPDSVKAEAQQNIEEYIKSLAFTDDNDVRYFLIGQAILSTEGVQDFQNLLVNGGTVNVPIDIQEVAVLGSVTFS